MASKEDERGEFRDKVRAVEAAAERYEEVFARWEERFAKVNPSLVPDPAPGANFGFLLAEEDIEEADDSLTKAILAMAGEGEQWSLKHARCGDVLYYLMSIDVPPGWRVWRIDLDPRGRDIIDVDFLLSDGAEEGPEGEANNE